MNKKIFKSYGLIVFKRDEPTSFLFVRRRDTHAYIDFLQGKYQFTNIPMMIESMTKTELNNIKTKSFDEMWQKLWEFHPANGNTPWHFEQKRKAKERFNKCDWKKFIVTAKDAQYTHADWGFPKGKLNRKRFGTKENPLDCALREFEEETGYSRNDIYVWNPPTSTNGGQVVQETNQGNDNNFYCNEYFIAELKNIEKELPAIDKNFRCGEISSMGWFSYFEAEQMMRPHQYNKLRALQQAYSIINPDKFIELSSEENSSSFE